MNQAAGLSNLPLPKLPLPKAGACNKQHDITDKLDTNFDNDDGLGNDTAERGDYIGQHSDNMNVHGCMDAAWMNQAAGLSSLLLP